MARCRRRVESASMAGWQARCRLDGKARWQARWRLDGASMARCRGSASCTILQSGAPDQTIAKVRVLHQHRCIERVDIASHISRTPGMVTNRRNHREWCRAAHGHLAALGGRLRRMWPSEPCAIVSRTRRFRRLAMKAIHGMTFGAPSTR